MRIHEEIANEMQCEEFQYEILTIAFGDPGLGHIVNIY